MYWGGHPYEPHTRGHWLKSAEGWYVLMTGRDPGHLARHAVIDGPAVHGPDNRQVWMVPRLLRWHPEAALISAVPEVLRVNEHGTYEWAAPKHLVPIMDRLRAMMTFGQPNIPVIHDDQARDLAVDVLALNYHISIHEMALMEWLSTELVRRVIETAAGLDEMRELLMARKGAHGG